MVITALDHVPHCFSQQDGARLHDVVAPYFDDGREFTLSFSGVEDMTSSFVNASLVPFVEQYGASFVKAHLKIVGATKQVANTIIRCINNAERVPAAA